MTLKNAHVAPPANGPRLYDFLQQAAVTAPPEQATTDPYLLAYPRFLVDVLVRDGKLLLLQFHLPYPLHRGEDPPLWWTRTFAESLNLNTYRFYGAARQNDLAAQHVRLEGLNARHPLDSWYLEVHNEALHCVTKTMEERTVEFLRLLSDHLCSLPIHDDRLPKVSPPAGTAVPCPAHLEQNRNDPGLVVRPARPAAPPAAPAVASSRRAPDFVDGRPLPPAQQQAPLRSPPPPASRRGR